MFSPLTKQLIDALCSLPGIGPKSAQRIAFMLLANAGRHKGLTLAQAVRQAIDKVDHCEQCRNFTEQSRCGICANPKRNPAALCVVETAADVAAIEHTSSYNGHYYVLHGHLSPLDGIGPAEIGIPDLLAYLEKAAVEELILATNPTMEGKATAQYIANHVDQRRIKCTRIAHGVPIGGEIEYLDGSTLAHALYSRLPIEA